MARWDGQIAEALVRSQKNTKDDEEEVTLAPICNTVQDKCGSEDKLSIPFNTRSYFQAKYNGSCDATPFGTGTYECVDYDQGALRLGGQTLSFEVDLSNDGCGCNAALYLVSMPQSHDESICHDRYCDANNVCGVRCTELDLMEANQIAWVSTVHVADDGSGQGFGYAHYVFPPEHRLSSPTHECAYGPSATCAIDTRSAFVAAISFSAPEELFSYTVEISQGGRSARLGPVRYVDKPQMGQYQTAVEANAALRASLDAGMTLVVSHWAGPKKESMGWLDSPCKPDEITGWACTDVFVEHSEWEWLCPVEDATPPSCHNPFTLTDVAIHPNPAPPPPPIAMTTADLMANVAIGTSFGVLIGVVLGYMLGARFGAQHRPPKAEAGEEELEMCPVAAEEDNMESEREI